MISYDRFLNLSNLLEKKSFFLLGPRSTGKSYLIRKFLHDKAAILNLLHPTDFLELSLAPSSLEAIIDARLPAQSNWVVIDEIQKLPILLDGVHRLIEERGLRFLLTGSSARKLRTGSTNLLGGRARTAQLFPLVSHEIPHFELDHFLLFGGLPSVYQSAEPAEDLRAYIQTYLEGEIKSEAIVRRLTPFVHFLKFASLRSGQTLNFTELGKEVGVSPPTIREYYQILEDTLFGFFVEPWTASTKFKAMTTPKFYFFDTGITHILAQTETLDRNSDLYGKSFEQWVMMEVRAYNSYARKHQELQYWRSRNGLEVDIIVGNHTAIEVKSTKKIAPSDLKGIKALKDEKFFKKYFVVSHDINDKILDHVECRHWKVFMKKLWLGEIF